LYPGGFTMHGPEKPPVILVGEKAAWDIIDGLSPDDVCRRSKASFDGKQKTFTMKMFSASLMVSLKKRLIFGLDRQSERLLISLGSYVAIPALHYLIHAADVPFFGNLVNPAGLTGGYIYLNGSNVLPLHLVVQKYSADREGFLARGRLLDAKQTNMGDAALLLLPFPRIVVAVILWLQAAR